MYVVRCSLDYTAVLLTSCLGIHLIPIIHIMVVPKLIVCFLPLYCTFLYMHVICHACIIPFVYGGSERNCALERTISTYSERPEIESRFGIRLS
jgi:hypothetical protein